MELDLKILNLGSAIAVVGSFLPWLSGEWLGGETVSFSGFGFYTSFIGMSFFAIHCAVVSISIVPMTTGRRVLKPEFSERARFYLSSAATLLLLAVLSVLTRFTFDFSRMDIRFGMYVSLIGTIVSTLYCFLRFREWDRKQALSLFQECTGQSEPSAHEVAQIPHPPEPDDHPLL